MRQSVKNLTEVRNLLQRTSHDRGQLNATNANDKFRLAIKFHYSPKSFMLSVWPWLLILVLAFGVQSVSAQTTWSLGYYSAPDAGGPSVPLSSIQWSALTHVIMVGGNPNSDGSITLSNGFSTDAPVLISAAHANNVKALYSLTNLGGGTHFTGAASSGNLSAFLANIMSTVNTYGFDGVDIDWEETFDQTEITNLMSGLRTALGTKVLTAASVNAASCFSAGQSWTGIIPFLDRMNILTYDLNGTWEPETWFNSPLYSASGTRTQSVDSDVNAVRNCGYPMAKIGIGLPFYGYLTSPSNGPYQSFGSSPSLRQAWYSTMLSTYGFSGSTYDTTAHEPWRALNATSWIQWDNPQSITDKVNYVKTNNLGGWVIWIIGMDYISSASPQMPLLDAIGKAFASRPQPPTGLQIILK